MTDAMRDEFLDEHNMRRSDVAEGAIPLGPRGYLCPTAARMPKLAMNEWFNGITKKGMNRQMNFTPGIPFKPELPPFTQMVWAATTKVGCVVVRCNNNQAFTVCRYSPRGNIVGQRVYVPGPVCSGCSSNCDRAFGLCNTP
ncbi:SCP-like protein [Ancylostoma duodenale]|uniref:SCP-like protein n=1 Tax=Ancylostoma duodenale TaxID=51022 RepID=A0A0C2D635_9BILA|nr:SCP-like protein [Ancylostoma duodenale]